MPIYEKKGELCSGGASRDVELQDEKDAFERQFKDLAFKRRDETLTTTVKAEGESRDYCKG